METSRSSAGASGGRMDGSRAASIDLPAPGGPTMSRLWPPAAATSSARLALSWPLMSARSRTAGRDFEDFRLRPRQHLRALEMIGQLDQRSRRDDLDFRARPGRFRSAFRRADQTFAARIRADGSRQHAGDRRDRAIEAELAQDGEAGQGVVRNGADRRHQPKRDRQIVVAAFLRQIRRREIDGDAARGQRQAGGDHRRAHPFARLGDGFVGQTDDGEGRHARRNLHLDVDGPDLDAFECDRGDALDHVRPCPGQTLPEFGRPARTFREHARGDLGAARQ